MRNRDTGGSLDGKKRNQMKGVGEVDRSRDGNGVMKKEWRRWGDGGGEKKGGCPETVVATGGERGATTTYFGIICAARVKV